MNVLEAIRYIFKLYGRDVKDANETFTKINESLACLDDNIPDPFLIFTHPYIGECGVLIGDRWELPELANDSNIEYVYSVFERRFYKNNGKQFMPIGGNTIDLFGPLPKRRQRKVRRKAS